MNPEEGNLRPQLLDRFGLCVEVGGVMHTDERVEIIKRRLEYEEDPESFIEKFETNTKELQLRIKESQKILYNVKIEGDKIELIADMCIGMGVDGHRGDISMVKTAKTIAAFNLREFVDDNDIKEAAKLVLIHRMKKNPFKERAFDNQNLSEIINKHTQEREVNRKIQAIDEHKNDKKKF